MHLWYVQSGVAYSHLSAFDQEGYSLGAAYALHWCAIQEFKQNHARELRWIDLGAGAGARGSASDGLSFFKRGWTATEKLKYFCGSVLDPEAYESLTNAKRSDFNYFPLYRVGELA